MSSLQESKDILFERRERQLDPTDPLNEDELSSSSSDYEEEHDSNMDSDLSITDNQVMENLQSTSKEEEEEEEPLLEAPNSYPMNFKSRQELFKDIGLKLASPLKHPRTFVESSQPGTEQKKSDIIVLNDDDDALVDEGGRVWMIQPWTIEAKVERDSTQEDTELEETESSLLGASSPLFETQTRIEGSKEEQELNIINSSKHQLNDLNGSVEIGSEKLILDGSNKATVSLQTSVDYNNGIEKSHQSTINDTVEISNNPQKEMLLSTPQQKLKTNPTLSGTLTNHSNSDVTTEETLEERSAEEKGLPARAQGGVLLCMDSVVDNNDGYEGVQQEQQIQYNERTKEGEKNLVTPSLEGQEKKKEIVLEPKQHDRPNTPCLPTSQYSSQQSEDGSVNSIVDQFISSRFHPRYNTTSLEQLISTSSEKKNLELSGTKRNRDSEDKNNNRKKRRLIEETNGLTKEVEEMSGCDVMDVVGGLKRNNDDVHDDGDGLNDGGDRNNSNEIVIEMEENAEVNNINHDTINDDDEVGGLDINNSGNNEIVGIDTREINKLIEWTVTEIEQLKQAFEKASVNSTSSKYIWNYVATSLSKDIDECKKKWRSLNKRKLCINF